MKKIITVPLIGIFSLFIFSSCIAEKKTEQAWWLNLSITPNQSELNSLAVTEHNKNWLKAIF